MAVPSFFKPSFSEFIEAALGVNDSREGSLDACPADQQQLLQQSSSGAHLSASSNVSGNPSNPSALSEHFSFEIRAALPSTVTGQGSRGPGLGLAPGLVRLAAGPGDVPNAGTGSGGMALGMVLLPPVAPAPPVASGRVDGALIGVMAGSGPELSALGAATTSATAALAAAGRGAAWLPPYSQTLQLQQQSDLSLQGQLQIHMWAQMQQLEALQQHTQLQQMQMQQMQKSIQIVRGRGTGTGDGGGGGGGGAADISSGSHSFSQVPLAPVLLPPHVFQPPLQQQSLMSLPSHRHQQQTGMSFASIAANLTGAMGPAVGLTGDGGGGGSGAGGVETPQAASPRSSDLHSAALLQLPNIESAPDQSLGLGPPSNPRPCKAKRVSYTYGYTDCIASPISMSPQGGLSPTTSVLVGQLSLGHDRPPTSGMGAAGTPPDRAASSAPSSLLNLKEQQLQLLQLQLQLQQQQPQPQKLQVLQQQQQQQQNMQQQLQQGAKSVMPSVVRAAGALAGNFTTGLLVGATGAELGGGLPPCRPASKPGLPVAAGEGASGTSHSPSQDFYALGLAPEGGGESNSDGDPYLQQTLQYHTGSSGHQFHHSQTTRDKNREAQRRYRERQRGNLASLQSRAEEQAQVIQGLNREKRMVEQHNKMLLERIWKLEASLFDTQAKLKQLELQIQQRDQQQQQDHTGSASGEGGVRDMVMDGRDAETMVSEGPGGERVSAVIQGGDMARARHSNTGSPVPGPGSMGCRPTGSGTIRGNEDVKGDDGGRRGSTGGDGVAALAPTPFQLNSWPAAFTGLAAECRFGPNYEDMEMFGAEPLPAAADSPASQGDGGTVARGGVAGVVMDDDVSMRV
ncbi:hypothetical protein VaNZ11_013711 [Volvox africanus]|uniref:BZIP domain-containing protein n=1 Tax=Volvox africanus TaxID=51714 RepID=A0ABQ5SIC1_9CHLO|nr:hypothetical protein VaNZ11_013711 [Volvox africanus]